MNDIKNERFERFMMLYIFLLKRYIDFKKLREKKSYETSHF
jgi:hypothetical protein